MKTNQSACEICAEYRNITSYFINFENNKVDNFFIRKKVIKPLSKLSETKIGTI